MHFDKFYIMCGTVLMTSFTVKLTKPWSPEIFMECFCVARNKPIRHEIHDVTKLQTATVINYLICGFEVCLRNLSFIVTASIQSTFLKLFRCSWFSEFDTKRKHDQLKSEFNCDLLNSVLNYWQTAHYILWSFMKLHVSIPSGMQWLFWGREESWPNRLVDIKRGKSE